MVSEELKYSYEGPPEELLVSIIHSWSKDRFLHFLSLDLLNAMQRWLQAYCNFVTCDEIELVGDSFNFGSKKLH